MMLIIHKQQRKCFVASREYLADWLASTPSLELIQLWAYSRENALDEVTKLRRNCSRPPICVTQSELRIIYLLDKGRFFERGGYPKIRVRVWFIVLYNSG